MEAEGHETLSHARRGELERGAARGAKPPSGSSSGASGPSRGDVGRRYGVAEKKALVSAYAAADAAGETMRDFAQRHGVSTATAMVWPLRDRRGRDG
jgi:hypothetical protein